MKFNFESSGAYSADVIVIGVKQDRVLTQAGMELDLKFSRILTRSMQASHFKGKRGQTLLVTAPEEPEASYILLIGLGDTSKLTVQALEELGGTIYSTLSKIPVESIEVYLEEAAAKDINDGQAAAAIAGGFNLRSWRFDKYRTKEKDENIPTLSSLTCITSHLDDAKKCFQRNLAVAEGVALTRELVSEAPNVLYPETFAEAALKLKSLGVDVEVMGEKQLTKLGMNALLGVGQGSAKESQLVVMSYHGGAKGEAPLAFIGKGVCFDSGGISIKPSANMDEMKYDMGGAGVVTGLMKALAGRKAKINAVGVIGLVENMPGGNAQRPGDIVTSMSGQTIEILNTDAEGRLVLADALWYTQDRFKPRLMINLATLTGAIVVSLGSEYAGLFSNNDEISQQLEEVGRETDEKLWRFPLHENYDKDINSDVADVQNIGKGRGAGSITAAQFLKRFVNDVPWAHLDIAGVAWTKTPLALCEKGATAFGVRLLDRFISKYYEN